MGLRQIFTALEMVLLVLFLVPLPVINAGNAVGIVISLAALFVTCGWDEFIMLWGIIWQSDGGKVLLMVIILLLSGAAVYAFVLSVNMLRAMRRSPEKPDILVVLGCKVVGERPSRMLRRRLNAAYEYMQEHKNVRCIVSGGQGRDEKIPEAEAMKRYLVSKGIDEERIIKEDKSTSTDENIENSLEIIDALGLERHITIVTDGFHQYRAGLIAKSHGVKEVHGISSHTEPRFLFTYWIREWLGLTKLLLISRR